MSAAAEITASRVHLASQRCS